MLTQVQLAQARAAQEAIMHACVTVRSPGDGYQWNPETRESEPVTSATIYSGPGNVQAASGGTLATIGGQQVTISGLVAKVPWWVTGIAPGQTVEVSSSIDPAADKQTYTVTAVEANTFALTCRRFLLEAAKESDHVPS